MQRLFAITLVFVCAACSPAPPPTATTPTTTKPAAAMPFAIEKLVDSYDGVVDEVVFIDGYVYVSVADRWCVSLKKRVAVGDHVDVKAFGHADNFHSQKLDRDFASLWFAIVTVTETQQQGEKT